ncbi:MAG: ABC transporter permease family protein, partial [Planctomycetota bacterium]
MRLAALPTKLLTSLCLGSWGVIVLVPLLVLGIGAIWSSPSSEMAEPMTASLLRSLLLAGIIAATAVVLGWLPGRLLGTSRHHNLILLLLLLMPLVLPRYVLYYAWTLLLSPTTQLGAALASRPGLARLVGTLTSTGVLVGWHWPLAALVLAQGWRGIDGRIWESALLDARPGQVFRHVTVPLLGRSVLLAFGVCFVLALSEFATFHLAGVETIGTELAVLYELTGSTSAVARAAWPVAVIALVAAVALSRASNRLVSMDVRLAPGGDSSHRRDWIVLAALLFVSLVAPVALLVLNARDLEAFRQFATLHSDDLGWSLATAGLAAVLAVLVALGGLLLGSKKGGGRTRSAGRHIVCVTIFLTMFLPASLVAVSLLRLLSAPGVPAAVRQGWFLVSVGQASRFAGLAFILLLLTRYPDRSKLTEMAMLDGASAVRTWWHVHLPRTWPVWVATFLLVLMFSFTELSATMVLLPAGLPN